MTLRAGASQQDISPRGPAALFGYPNVERISTGIHDPLLASVLYLEKGDTRLVLASLDILFIDPPTARKLRRAVARAVAVPEDCVFISCTHTHSGPVTDRLLAWSSGSVNFAFLRRIQKQVVQSCRAAAASAVPAELAWTTADATGVGGNRISPRGVIDPECGILAVRNRRTQKLLSVAMIYGMHPTVLHEDSKKISSDFPHYARKHLREVFGGKLVVVYHNAPCGNQSPRYFVKAQTFAEAERLGNKLGKAAASSLVKIREKYWCADPVLAGKRKTVTLPRRRLLPLQKAKGLLEEYRWNYRRLVAENAPHPEVRTAECAVFGAESTLQLAKAFAQGHIERLLKKYSPIEVQTLRIGEVCVAGFPGECFTEYALLLKKKSKMKTFAVSLVNGELQGYIVTKEAEAKGGYEATNSLFAPSAGNILVSSARKLADALFRRK